ncbi:MAG TPA: glycosyltransferase family 4 protein [Phycisphaerae bacterium]|nr:glycosyltransferase family 4 protein [Phycisphaerae bacterium]HRY67965.1 glycosyltransferase family 4 protein [Phycisphaerae bacterium]HSA26702.1 glycosyltransferase family 4 protein [Phycisphaerae bacterium]
MRVALIIERIETWRGGAETSTLQFAQHLAELGAEVHILTTTHAPSTPDLTVVPIRASHRLRGSRAIAFAHRVGQTVREGNFDIVHSIIPCAVADIYQPRGGTVPEMLERNLAIRSARLARGLKKAGQCLNLKYRAIARMERQLLTRRPPPWVIAISHYVSDQLHRHYGFDRSRVREIFNGVDGDETPVPVRVQHRAELRRQFRLADNELMLLCVAHNFKLKGVDRLIEAVARIESQGGVGGTTGKRRLRTLVVGRDNPRAAAQLAHRLGVADRITFTGSTQRIQAFFHAADVLVHPTFYDPCSRVVLEALASGLPVITTRFNGAAERVTDGREGYVIDSPMDIAALAEAIMRLADDDHRRACAAAAPRVVEGVSMRVHAQRVYELYMEVQAGGDLRQGGYR